MDLQQANFVTEVTVVDPDTGGDVKVAIFKHQGTGGMFGIDASYLDQTFEDNESMIIPDIFYNDNFTNPTIELMQY
jgi:hypothetical protein